MEFDARDKSSTPEAEPSDPVTGEVGRSRGVIAHAATSGVGIAIGLLLGVLLAAMLGLIALC